MKTKQVDKASVTKKVVFVDDNDIDLLLYGTMLKKLNYDVSLIQNPITAECDILELDPDIVFLDISMKGNISGLDIVKTIRTKGYKGVICMISGHSETSYIKRALDVGADDYIVKPVYSSRLNNLIERV